MYTIKAYYRTGDSFHSEDTTTNEGEWNNLDIAKENLQRMKVHYDYYSYKNKFASMAMEKKWKNKPVPKYILEEHGMLLLKLKADNGKEYQIFPPWCGYFESLYGAEIITIDDGTMKFEV